MIKTRQRTLRLFEFEAGGSTQEYIDFITKHLPLLQRHTLGFRDEIEPKLQTFLQEHNLSFANLSDMAHIYVTHQDSLTLSQSSQSHLCNVQVASSSALFINKVVRSGEEIYHNGDIVVQSQVNSGARIIAEGNLLLLSECSGSIESQGDYIICTKILAPTILFQDALLDETFLRKINQSSALFKIIFKKDDDVSIKDLV
ncbi:septum site-determining protein MinC [Helicobacter sp. MIT 21-1697]|uniref:septum site-determining protein MinC n=1 Tax=Helicobacter sp. MIT 21-1697 TaxID=2993733 RepID=UPI00224B7295|nr:septum site-determining protein MinC [Helicobacter sp. MIT 21-1697]MCX2717739.1 septum site-determining protein MinC [Helicobacter sp. MIT 21-1697]